MEVHHQAREILRTDNISILDVAVDAGDIRYDLTAYIRHLFVEDIDKMAELGFQFRGFDHNKDDVTVSFFSWPGVKFAEDGRE